MYVCMYVLAKYDELPTHIIGSGTRGVGGTCPSLCEPQNLKSDIRNRLDLYYRQLTQDTVNSYLL